jgi:hypothetical protein
VQLDAPLKRRATGVRDSKRTPEMTHERATLAANAIMAAAAAAAAYYLLRTPHLRRSALGLATTALAGTLPAWLDRELRRAWEESATVAPARERDMMTA